MIVLTLEGKTSTGKDKIKFWGNKWQLLDERPHTACFKGAPGLLVQSIFESKVGIRDLRWIKVKDDENFTVIKKEYIN